MHQLKGNLNYPIYQSGRGLGSRLFNIVKSVGAPILNRNHFTDCKGRSWTSDTRYN